VDDPDAWVAAWARLAGEVGADPLLAPVTMLDLANEPDCLSLGWGPGGGGDGEGGGEGGEGNTPPFPGMAVMYHRASAAVHAVYPMALLVIEGTGQVGTGPANNWGDGYATSVGEGPPEAGAAAFFTAALAAPYAANLVLGPHLYPPSISMRAAGAGDGGPPGLAGRLDSSFGAHTLPPGYCGGEGASPPPCRAFPWLVGETGARDVGDGSDGPFLEAVADYAGRPTPPPGFGGFAAPAAAAALAPASHSPAAGLYWWSWNANSGDTGERGVRDVE